MPRAICGDATIKWPIAALHVRLARSRIFSSGIFRWAGLTRWLFLPAGRGNSAISFTTAPDGFTSIFSIRRSLSNPFWSPISRISGKIALSKTAAGFSVRVC